MMIEMSALSRLTGGIRDLLPFCHGREKTKELKLATRHYELYSVSPPETTTTTEEAAFGAKKTLSLGLSNRDAILTHTRHS